MKYLPMELFPWVKAVGNLSFSCSVRIEFLDHYCHQLTFHFLLNSATHQYHVHWTRPVIFKQILNFVILLLLIQVTHPRTIDKFSMEIDPEELVD